MGLAHTQAAIIAPSSASRKQVVSSNQSISSPLRRNISQPLAPAGRAEQGHGQQLRRLAAGSGNRRRQTAARWSEPTAAHPLPATGHWPPRCPPGLVPSAACATDRRVAGVCCTKPGRQFCASPGHGSFLPHCPYDITDDMYGLAAAALESQQPALGEPASCRLQDCGRQRRRDAESCAQ